MRLNRASQCQPVNRRSGVTDSVASTNTSVQVPVERRIVSTGLTPSRSSGAPITRRASGPRHSTNMSAFVQAKTRGERIASERVRGFACFMATADAARQALEELVQVHPGVEACHLIAVTVEHERLALGAEQAVLTDASFGSLTPARMVHVGIHVRIEAVFVGGRFFPRDFRLLFDEAYAYDRLGTLEAVFPRH